MARARLKSLSTRAILLAGWIVFLLYAYPGFLTDDAVDQLIDSRTGSFTDWHPVVMTQVWRIVGVFISGPAGMLMLQSGLFLVSTYVLLRKWLSGRGAAITSACLLVFPPVMAGMAIVCGESQLVGFSIAAIACLTSARTWVRFAGLGLAVLACGVCNGGALAVLPIVVLGFVWITGLRWWQRYGIAVCAWLAVVVTSMVLASSLIDTKTRRAEATTAMFDLVGTIAFAPDTDDASLRALMPGVRFAGSDLQNRARLAYGDPSRFANGANRLFEEPEGLADAGALARARSRLVRTYPSAYLATRWNQALELLGLSRARGWTVNTHFISAPLRAPAAHAAYKSSVQRTLHKVVRLTARTPLFVPYVYCFAAILLLPIAIRRRNRLAATLLATGLVLEAALFIVTSTAEYRHSLWLIASTSVAIVSMIASARASLQKQDHGGDADRADHPVGVSVVGIDADGKEAQLVEKAAEK